MDATQGIAVGLSEWIDLINDKDLDTWICTALHDAYHSKRGVAQLHHASNQIFGIHFAIWCGGHPIINHRNSINQLFNDHVDTTTREPQIEPKMLMLFVVNKKTKRCGGHPQQTSAFPLHLLRFSTKVSSLFSIFSFTRHYDFSLVGNFTISFIPLLITGVFGS